MACKACGEEPQKCNCQHKDSCMSPAVLEIVNEPEIVTFCKVVIPASAGDEKTNPPLPGLYRNVLLEYEASGEAYLYSSDGIPTKLTDKAELKRLETLIGNEVADRYNADVNLQNQINEIDVSGLETRVTNVEGTIQSLGSDLATERSERIAADEHDQEGIRLLGEQMLGRAERVAYYYDNQMLYIDEDKTQPAEFSLVAGHAYFNHDFVVVRYKDADLYLESQNVATASTTGTLVFSNVVTTDSGLVKYTLTATMDGQNYTVTATETPVDGGGSTEDFPNVTIIGNPTINEGQVSNFNDYRYLQFPFVLDLTGKTFQIDFCFTTGNDITTQQNIIDSKFGVALAIQNGHGIMSISSNGEFWDIGTSTGQINIAANTTYYARLSWDGSVYKTALSTDGVTYTDDMAIAGSNRPFPTTHYIGGANSQILGRYAWPFLGIINLNKCSMTVNGSLIWKGMDNLGLLTRADISLSNIDTAGEQRIKDLAGGGGNVDFAPTNPTVIGKYDGKDLYRVAIPLGNRTFAASDTIPSGEAGQIIGYITNFTEDSKVVRTYGSISKSSPYAYPRQPRGSVAVPFVEFTEGNSARIWVGESDGQYMPTPVVLTVTGSSLYGWEGDYAVVEYTI